MNVMEYIVALERRVAALEANRGTSLRFAEVTEVEKVGQARVKLLDGDEMISHPLRTVQRRTLKDKDQCFPDIGEHVACLFSGQGLEQGLVLGAVYSDKNHAPDQETHAGYYRYADGTVIHYDREAHKLTADVKGDIEVRCTKSANVAADEDITAKAKGRLTAEAGDEAAVKAGATLILEGGAGIRLRAPSIVFENLGGGKTRAVISADLDIEGDIAQTGSQTVSGGISAGGLVSGNPVHGCDHD